MKNTFALINKTPLDVLSLIPNCWEDNDRDEGLIKLTHVCRSWREIFISCPSLWTRLDCMNVDKTRVYIERSKSSPLGIDIGRVGNASYREEAFVLAIPHIGRLRNLSISGNPTKVLPTLVEYFSCPVLLLNELNINFICGQAPTLPDKLFNGDLPSLRELCLAGVTTPLPWRDLSNLTTFKFSHVPGDKILSTQLLDFFESTPNLRYIQFLDSIPNSSDAPVERVVSLPHLKKLDILAQPAHSILLNHLSIPARASLRLEFTFSGGESPISSYLPKSPDNLNNLSHITAVNLCFGAEQKSMRLSGPSGELSMTGNWARGGHQPHVGEGRFLSSLNQFDSSRTQRLAITLYCHRRDTPTQAETWVLRSMEGLRTLVFSRCSSLPFILILNPNKNPDTNPDKSLLCPKLEEIVLYVERPDQFYINELLSMAEERASRGAKLSGITIVSTAALAPMKEVFQLRKYVSRVEYKFDDAPPAWDSLPGAQS